jgi:hypothetical protein
MVSGSAVITSGPTADTVGIHMGPGAGTATIGVSTTSPNSSGYIWSAEVLVSGSGSFSVNEKGCESANAGKTNQAPADYAWFSAQSCTGVGSDPSRTVTIAISEGTVLDIADVRMVGLVRSEGCSVSGRRRLLR